MEFTLEEILWHLILVLWIGYALLRLGHIHAL